ncbi:hypothetical protein ACFXAZ_13440 [Streptomyces sp. NPDC059477]|uniref:hypothetical protein n=1 Tax=Streptomyces sp. NPDC059477 TaxID=3346847 RepID=UPI00368565D4
MVSQSGTALGTVACMAPEQALGGRATSAADVLDLGVATYQGSSGTASVALDVKVWRGGA